MSSFSLFDEYLKSAFQYVVIFKLKLGVSRVFNVSYQHCQSRMFVLHTQSFFFNEKINYCERQVPSLLIRFAFAHLLCSGYPALRRNHSTCFTSNPFRCSDYMTALIIYCYILLNFRINGFVRFCTLRHRCPPDEHPFLNINLTLKS